MKFVATVHEPMYEFNNKKYIRFVIPIKVSEIIERMHTQRSHLLVNQNDVVLSLDDSVHVDVHDDIEAVVHVGAHEGQDELEDL